MSYIYYVDAATPSLNSLGIVRDFHLETPDQAEAESKFIRCWFSDAFWDVRIKKEWKKENRIEVD